MYPVESVTDYAGNNRIAGSAVDIGIYEMVNNNTDTDGDGIVDINDNCPLIANANQLDADNDGFGAVCDCDDTPSTGASCNTGCSTFYLDSDNDSYGDPAVSVTTCVAPGGYVSNNQDCNDNDNSIYPDAPEICDGKDNDCNPSTLEDEDGDGVCNEDDICPGGDDTVDLNNNNIPDACESTITLNCPIGINVTAATGQNTAFVIWPEPTGTSDCNGGGTGGGSCTAAPIVGFTHIGEHGGHDYYKSNTGYELDQCKK